MYKYSGVLRYGLSEPISRKGRPWTNGSWDPTHTESQLFFRLSQDFDFNRQVEGPAWQGQCARVTRPDHARRLATSPRHESPRRARAGAAPSGQTACAARASRCASVALVTRGAPILFFPHTRVPLTTPLTRYCFRRTQSMATPSGDKPHPILAAHAGPEPARTHVRMMPPRRS